jgi:hypothetical protein
MVDLRVKCQARLWAGLRCGAVSIVKAVSRGRLRPQYATFGKTGSYLLWFAQVEGSTGREGLGVLESKVRR